MNKKLMALALAVCALAATRAGAGRADEVNCANERT